jgi:hypothetical protein
MQATKFSADSAGLHVVVYPGDNKILIAMSLDDSAVNDTDKNLAGFAIWRTNAGKPEAVLPNRIGFTVGVNNQTTAETHEWTNSDKAPFQKFRWVDVPEDGFAAPMTYRVQALYFTGKGFATKAEPEVTIKVEPVKQLHSNFRPAFTRGYIASQAYTDKFKNKDIRPAGPKKPDFDSNDYSLNTSPVFRAIQGDQARVRGGVQPGAVRQSLRGPVPLDQAGLSPGQLGGLRPAPPARGPKGRGQRDACAGA